MNNIKRIVDALIVRKGDSIVIGMQEPVFLLAGQQKIPMLRKTLSDREFTMLKQELSDFSAGESRFIVNENMLQIEEKPGIIEIRLLPSVPENTEADVPAIVESKSGPDQPENEKEEAEPAHSAGIMELIRQFDVDTIEGLLCLMVRMGASDLHLSSNCSPYMRIDGEMQQLEVIPGVSSEELWERLICIMPKRNQEEFSSLKDSDFAHEISGFGRFRSNIFQDHKGIGAVFRLIPSDILTAEQLMVPPVMLELCKMPKGLILVTGPTGSGKSTTLASLIDHINRTQRKHIITIEDPVEFVHQNQMSLVNQREIHTHTSSFKKALRAALREDPDIILVGEMRDLETIAIAIEMAVTGHLVLGTLHTSTAVSTVDRIIDQFPSDQQSQIKAMLADALIGVVSQMLLKRITGGRVAAYEVMVANVAVSNLIREGKTYQINAIMQTGKKMGQQMLNAHLCQLVKDGIVTSEEALAKAIDKENLKALIRGVS